MSTKYESHAICRSLSWIAFRKHKFLTDDPNKLRADMRRYSRQVVEPNPAAHFLHVMRSGNVRARAQHPVTMATMPMTVIDWMQMTEDDVWKQAELDWLHRQGKLELQVEHTPSLRTKMVADDGREFENLGAVFFEWVEDRHFNILEFLKKLDEERCRDFWTWLGRTDRVPKSLELFFFAEDARRIWPGMMGESE